MFFKSRKIHKRLCPTYKLEKKSLLLKTLKKMISVSVFDLLNNNC